MTDDLSQEYTYASGTGLVLWVHTFHAIKMHLGGDSFTFRSVCVFKTGRNIIEFWGCSLLHLNKEEGAALHFHLTIGHISEQRKRSPLSQKTSVAGRGRTEKNGMTMAT